MRKSRSSSSKRSSALLPPSADSQILRNVLLALFLLSVLGMCFLFGGTRYWAAGPFLFPIFISTAGLFCISYFKAEETGRGLVLPKDYFFWTLLIAYVIVRALAFSPVPFETWTECFLLTSAWLLYGSLSDLGNQKNAWTLTAGLFFLAAIIQAGWAINLHWNESRMVLWIVRPEHYEMRASGTYICPNHYAHFLQMAMIVAWGVLFTPRVRLWFKFLAGYTFLICAIPLVLSLSRSAVIGTFIGISVILLGKALRKGWKRTAGALLLLLAIGFLALFALWNFFEPFHKRLANDITNNIRISQVWPDTWSMIKKEGFWGTGPGTFANAFDTHREAFSSSNLYLEYAHNEFLNTLAEYGWLVSILWMLGLLTLLIVWIRKTVSTPSDKAAMIPIIMMALFSGTFAHAVFDFNLHIPSNALLFIGLLGILYGQGVFHKIWGRKSSLSILATRMFCVSGFILCMVLLFFTLRLMMGSFYEHRMNLMDEAGNFEEKYKAASKIRAWTPWNARGWTSLGLEHRKKAFWLNVPEKKQAEIDLSRKAYQEALRRNNLDKIAVAGLMELARMEGRNKEALRLVEQLKELAPFDIQVRIQQGLILRELGQYQAALDVFLEAKTMRSDRARQINLNIKKLRTLIAQQQD